MFTDLVGYSALAHRDEALAIELLQLHRGWVREILPRHGGTEIETVGDAFLIEFSGALAAMECALAIQRRFAEHNRSSGPNRRMELRIGVHLGDVEHEDGKVMGDGVNIASRIHGMARPGGICVSEQVRYSVRNRAGMQFRSLGKPALKNIATPLELFAYVGEGVTRDPRAWRAKVRPWATPLVAVALLAGTAVIGWRLAGVPAPAAMPSVAVLPFENLSADPDNAFFTDGLHDTVIGHLARIRDLKVISRTSVMGYRGHRESLRAIAGELGVDHILEGSVQRTGGRMRVVAQLIDARTDAHVWSNEYDAQLADVFAVQADLARQVATAVHARLSHQEQGRIEHAPTTSPEAYDLYLRAALAERNWGTLTNQQTFEAAAWLDRAVKLDPGFALAHALQTYIQDTLYWSGVDPTPARHALAVASADAAMKLDPGLSEAHAARGLVLYHERKYDEALRELDTALELAPGNSSVYLYQMAIYRRQGRWQNAMASGERAAWLDPLNEKVVEAYARIQELMRRYAEVNASLARLERIAADPRWLPLRRAQNHFRSTGELGPLETAVQAASSQPDDACVTTETRFNVHTWQGRYDQAARAALACTEFYPEAPQELWAALAYWMGGNKVEARRYGDKALAILQQSLRDTPHLGNVQMNRGIALAAIGDRAAALSAVDEALRATPMSADALLYVQVLGQAAHVHGMLGERERALSELKQILEVPSGYHAHELRRDPEFESMRDDPRFQKLIADHLPQPGS